MKLSKEQKIGLFAIVTLFSIYVVINYLKGQDLFSKRNTYYAVYHNVEGLTATGPVYIRGLKVGTVEAIDYIQERDNFIVKLRVKSNYVLPANSVAEIYSADLLGTKALRINIGDGSIHLRDKDTLMSATEAGLITMLTDEFLPLKNDIKKLILALNTTVDNVNEILSPRAKEDIAKSLRNLSKTLEGTSSMANDLKGATPQVKEMIIKINSLSAQLGETTGKLNKGLDNVVEITDSLKRADIAGTMNELKDLLIQIKNPEGSFGKLMQTDSLHNSIEGLIRDIDELVLNITKNPKKYIKISVF